MLADAGAAPDGAAGVGDGEGTKPIAASLANEEAAAPSASEKPKKVGVYETTAVKEQMAVLEVKAEQYKVSVPAPARPQRG